ncbi:MAG TPA: hypothetical protein PLS83_05660, partial [Methanothrix soehngenii]|nr:hypothetical protein [Methanothrix soehngenii]
RSQRKMSTKRRLRSRCIDLRLKVEQNHLVDGEVISKNHITYTPNSILVCNFPRPAGQRDFEASCRTY